jgi:hypothetical protein
VVESARFGYGRWTKTRIAVVRLVWLSFLFVATGVPAMADSVCALHEDASLPADFSNGDIRVDVGVNGAMVKFKIGTGSNITQISKRLMRRLGLSIEIGNLQVVGVAETEAPDVVDISDFKIGEMEAHTERFILTNEGGDGTDGNFAGVLGQDFLDSYDIELDPTENRVNLFRPIRCAGQVVYWWDEHFELPLTLERYRTPIVQVTLDGKAFDAYVDTGASKSRMEIDVAQQQLGVPGDIKVPRGRSGEPASSRPLYTFKELVFGPITLRNPRLELQNYDDIAVATGTHARRALARDTPLVIGMDILGRFHTIISRGNGKIYFTLPTERKPLQASVPKP